MKLLYVDNRAYGRTKRRKKKKEKGRSLEEERKKTKKIGEEASTAKEGVRAGNRERERKKKIIK